MYFGSVEKQKNVSTRFHYYSLNLLNDLTFIHEAIAVVNKG